MAKKRFWEVDFLRGIAVLLMIVYHSLFYVDYFGISKLPVTEGGYKLLQMIIAVLFVSLSGVSIILVGERGKYSKASRLKVIIHGILVFCMGLVVTLATWIFLGQGTVIFGILHMLGVSIMLGALFWRLKYSNLILGLIFLAIGSYIGTIWLNYPWLVWLGFKFPGFFSYDYYPLLPWIGLVFIGMFAGKMIYSGYARLRQLKFLGSEIPNYLSAVCFFGRNSLAIYMIHIPILFGLIWLISLLVK